MGRQRKKLKASFALTLALTVLVGALSFGATANAAETAIEDGEPYIAAVHPETPPFGYGQSWAVGNLALSISGATLALIIGFRALGEKKGNEHYGFFASDEHENNNATRLALTLLKLLMAAIGIILFIITQDMRLPVGLVDWWTVAHVALLAAGTAIYIFAYRNDRKSGNETSAKNAT